MVWGKSRGARDQRSGFVNFERGADWRGGDERLSLKRGDVIMIPSGVKHRFTTRAQKLAVTFNVYLPPAYPAG
ncbi:MAG: hypothetical protein DME75_07705 [Verrucomicrobia bacterium]|nr:MAG: hypothetical protein DME75_07705 [Verrucomicrobiota bacterium]